MHRVVVAFTAGIIIFAILYAINSYKIADVDCVSQFTKCNENILNSLNKVEKGNVIVTRRNIVKAISQNPLIKKYSVQLNLNGKYIVMVEERVPKYCVEGEEEKYISDSEGLIIKINDSGSIMCIDSVEEKYKLGDRLSVRDYFNETLLYKMRDISGIGNIYLEQNNLVVEYKGSIKLLFPKEGDTDVLAGKAYYTVSQFDKIEKYIIEIGNYSISEIDFRFNDPVVKFI